MAAMETAQKSDRRSTYSPQIRDFKTFAPTPVPKTRVQSGQAAGNAPGEMTDDEREFEEYCVMTDSVVINFSRRAQTYINMLGWDVHKFANKTHLDDNFFYKIMDGVDYKPKLEAVLNICIGLGLIADQRKELIDLAGAGYQVDKKYRAYMYVFEKYVIKTAEDFNDAYMKVQPHAKSRPLKEDL